MGPLMRPMHRTLDQRKESHAESTTKHKKHPKTAKESNAEGWSVSHQMEHPKTAKESHQMEDPKTAKERTESSTQRL